MNNNWIHALRHALRVRARSGFFYHSHLIGSFMQIFRLCFLASCVCLMPVLRSGSGVNAYLIVFVIYAKLYAKQFFLMSSKKKKERERKKKMVEWIPHPRKFNRQRIYLSFWQHNCCQNAYPCIENRLCRIPDKRFFFALRTNLDGVASRLLFSFVHSLFFQFFFSTNNGLSSSFTDCFHAKSIE